MWRKTKKKCSPLHSPCALPLPPLGRSPFFSCLAESWEPGRKGRRERARMRDDRKKRDTERARERFKPSRGRRERNEDMRGGEGADRRNVSQGYVMTGRKPLSPLLLPLFSYFSLVQGMHGTRKGNGSKRMRERKGESGRSLPCLTFFVPLTSPSHSSDAYSCQKSVERSEW